MEYKETPAEVVSTWRQKGVSGGIADLIYEKIKYDSKHDVLYITLCEMHDPYGDEDPSGIVILRELKTNKICAITIFEFSKRLIQGCGLSMVLPSSVDFDKDILPYIH